MQITRLQNSTNKTQHLLTPSIINEFHATFNTEANNVQRVAQNAITHASLSKIVVNPHRADELHATFSDELDINTTASDQKQSGRCWLFSFLNVLRAHTIKKYNLDPSFEFSQSYVFFWDQFEKCNLFLHHMWMLRDKPTDDPVVREMLKEPLSDGGQWHMIQNIVSKYGVVPHHCMGESYQANQTDKMTNLLCTRLREFAHALRTQPGVSEEQLPNRLKPMLYEIYTVLCVFLGEPPSTVKWEFHPLNDDNSDGNETCKKNMNTCVRGISLRRSSKKTTTITKKPYIESETLTPLEFYKTYVDFPMNDYVTVINYPHSERPFHRRFVVRYLNNMVGGRVSELYNLPIQSLKTIARRSIDAGEPVWFCSDVDKDFSSKYSILDPCAFQYSPIFGSQCSPHAWDKGARMAYKDGTPNHAMVLRGYHLPRPERSPRVSSKKNNGLIQRNALLRTTQRATNSQYALPMNNSSAKKRLDNNKSKSKSKLKIKTLKTLGGKNTSKMTTTQTTDQPTRWLVENSWGDAAGNDGHLVMSNMWFDRHVYEIAVHKRHLEGLWREKPNQDVITLELWDVFGSLFTTKS